MIWKNILIQNGQQCSLTAGVGNKLLATAARFSSLVPQPDSGQGEFKVSYYLSEQAATEVLPNLNQL